MRWYGLRAALLAVALCAVPLAVASIWLGLVGAAAVSALLIALGWISFFHSERTVLSAVDARLVSEVERPDLFKHVGELARLARLPLPRVYVSPNPQPNILTIGYGPRSAALCCTEGLLRTLTADELRAVLAHEFSHVIRRDVAVSSWSAGVVSLVGISPFNALLLQIAAPPGREYGADTDGALLTGDPLAMASALRKIDTGAAASPLPPRGSLTAVGHLMIAHPFPSAGIGRLLRTHPPTGERVRRLEALAGSTGSGGARLARTRRARGVPGLAPAGRPRRWRRW